MKEKEKINNFLQGQIKYDQIQWNKLLRNMTQLTTYFENMESGITYYIGLILNIDGVLINSEWQEAETKCNREFVMA